MLFFLIALKQSWQIYISPVVFFNATCFFTDFLSAHLTFLHPKQDKQVKPGGH